MKIIESSIELKQLRFYAYHGAMAHEQRVGNTFIVDAHVHLRECGALATDDLSETVNYATIYEMISEEMQQPSQLLEHVVGRILTRIGRQFPTVKSATVTIAKVVPPIPGVDGEGIAFSATATY